MDQVNETQKFTPGPWEVESMFGYPTALGVGVKGAETALAVLTQDSNGGAETQSANARLIAAAPGLYQETAFAVANGEKWTIEDWRNWRVNHAAPALALASGQPTSER